MKKKNFTILFSSLLFLALVIGIFLLPKSISSWRWNMAAEAAGSMPYQIGLTKVVIDKCMPGCCSNVGCRCCIGTEGIGTELCGTILDVEARCALYSGVIGTPAGGMGNNALFLDTAIAQAGLTPGGQLIAGGMSMVLMDQGVLASAGGCYGCLASKDSVKDRMFAWLDKFIIAGFKD
jgi:hypothetical protein